MRLHHNGTPGRSNGAVPLLVLCGGRSDRDGATQLPNNGSRATRPTARHSTSVESGASHSARLLGPASPRPPIPRVGDRDSRKLRGTEEDAKSAKPGEKAHFDTAETEPRKHHLLRRAFTVDMCREDSKR